jgi:predicted Zn finger-like uncharacterized protein
LGTLERFAGEFVIDLPPHQVTCPSCRRTYNIDLALVPPQGARVACRRCGERFVVQPPGAAPVAAGDDASRRPSTMPPEAARRRVWVFPDDPALQRPGVMAALRSALESCIFEVIEAETRTELIQSAHERDEWPDVVVFGDMPVLLEDRLLRTVATRSNVLRVLVSTHHNPELVRVARQYCGFDRHLALPMTPSDIRQALTLEMP